MTSIRDQILGELVTRLGALPDWDSQLRGVVNQSPPGAKVYAVVGFLIEEKRIDNSDGYLATMQVGVLITVHLEDADATEDEGNAYRYLDRMVTEAERTIHAPDAWGPDPLFSYVEITGHEVGEPDTDSSVSALLRLTFTYRHTITDPGES